VRESDDRIFPFFFCFFFSFSPFIGFVYISIESKKIAFMYIIPSSSVNYLCGLLSCQWFYVRM